MKTLRNDQSNDAHTKQTVTLPDGSRTTALAPLVYLAPKAGDLAANGQLFGGNAGSGQTRINAGGKVTLGTVQTGMSSDVTHDAANDARVQEGKEVGSTISGGGSVAIAATRDVAMRAAQVNAKDALSVSSTQGNVTLEAGQDSYGIAMASHAHASGLLGSSTVTQRSNSQSTTAQASELGGKTVAIRSAGDTRIQGSNVLADQRLDIDAGGDLRIEAAQNTRSSSNFDETTKSGLLSSGGISLSIGSQRQSSAAQDTRTTTAASTVGAIGGDVNLRGRAYTQTGSDVLTPEGNIDIAAKNVSITEARETGSQSTEQRFRQSGLSVGLSGGLLDGLQATGQALKGATGGGSDRSKALNDQHGHLEGDRVLKAFADVCRRNVRPDDAIGRLGGEEFLIVLRGLNAADSAAVIQRLRQELAASWGTGPDAAHRVTFSCGIAQVRPGEHLDDLLQRADVALYAAKRGGRDRSVCSG
ncbi:diguanylate cyclase [Leptothrix sp. BB-4]